MRFQMKNQKYFFLNVAGVVIWRNGTLKHLAQWATLDSNFIPQFFGERYILSDEGRWCIYE